MSTLMTLANAAGAMPWISTAQLPGVRPATDEERAQIGTLLKGRFIVDDFGDNAFLVHDGDLHVPGHFAPNDLLLVRGNLRVDGVYDDDHGGAYGIVAVLGDMQVQNIYSWASLYVRGDLHAQAMVVTVYNDFTFEVGGKLHAAGILAYDKAANYTAGELGFAFNDEGWRANDLPEPVRSRHEAGLRRLRPEFISAPGFRDPVDEDSSVYYQPVDYRALRAAMHAGQPLLRDTPAPAELLGWLTTAFDFEADDAALLALIGKDPLVDQLMAARVELSAPAWHDASPPTPPPMRPRLNASPAARMPKCGRRWPNAPIRRPRWCVCWRRTRSPRCARPSSARVSMCWRWSRPSWHR